MSDPTAEAEKPAARRRTAPVLARRIPVLRPFDRWLARLGVVAATLTLTAITVGAAVLGAIIAGYILYGRPEPGGVLAAAIISIVVGGPMIAYAQWLLARLRESRRTLARMTEQLALARDAAEAANLAKSRFLAGMSHELRTPLNAIIGFAEIMRGQMLGPIGAPRYLEYARDIHESGSHLLAIINDVLDLSKLDAGHALMEPETECDLEPVLEACIRMMRPIAQKAQVALAAETGRGYALLAVDRMLRQMLLNLLSNAIKFTPAGGSVAVSVAEASDGSLAIVVTDSGIGMTRDEIKIALTPFGQVRNGLATTGGSSGLGLPLVKAMMRMHDGALHIRSARGRGTTATLSFPAARVVATPRQSRIAIAS